MSEASTLEAHAYKQAPGLKQALQASDHQVPYLNCFHVRLIIGESRVLGREVAFVATPRQKKVRATPMRTQILPTESELLPSLRTLILRMVQARIPELSA